jgi:BNR/Asp-box repeat protein
VRRTRWTYVALLAFAVVGLALPSFVVAGDEMPLERDELPKVSGSLSHLLSGPGGGVGGGSVSKSTCTSSGNPAANIQLNCDDPRSPDNETPIVADPLDPNHLLAGSNDYFLTFTGATLQARVPTGFFTSFDGGHTWIDGQIPMGNGASSGNGDPSPAFDSKFHTAHMAQLSAAQGAGSPFAGHIDVSVSTSRDGGVSWGPAVTVAVGHASISPSANGVFLDKEWLVADNYPSSPHYGRLYLSWDQLEFSKGQFQRSPVVLSYSDDAGKTWTRPVEISGSSPTYCTANQGPAGPVGACDESFFSYPVVRPNGDVVVGFMNQQHSAAWESPNEFEDQILTVTSHDGGITWQPPVHVEDLEDGGIEGIVFTDYPANVDGRATQTGYQFRTGSWGNLNVDPVTGILYAVWTDNRDGVHDVANPVTDTNVFMAVSTDGGATWSAPIRVTSGASDKWFPWVAARAGTIGVVYQEEAGTGTYNTRLATSTNGGASWSYQTVSTAVSDANHSVWFRAHAPDCDECATFIGDYIGLTFDTLGRAHITWTDMRRDIAVPEIGRTGKAEDDVYAQR